MTISHLPPLPQTIRLPNVERCRAGMHAMGLQLGRNVLAQLATREVPQICVICTAQDADQLARGAIEAFEAAGHGERVRLLCVWNEMSQSSDFRAAPVMKEYHETFSPTGTVFVVVKALMLDVTVLATNVTRALSYSSPETIYLATSMIRQGLVQELSQHFPEHVAKTFCAVPLLSTHESVGNDEETIASREHNLYKSLGLDALHGVRRHVPELVRTRRKLSTQLNT